MIFLLLNRKYFNKPKEYFLDFIGMSFIKFVGIDSLPRLMIERWLTVFVGVL